MSFVFYVAIAMLGLCIGSFLNVVILRLEKSETLGGRSYCPNCKHQLMWLDLLPVLSFLWLLGKCRYCAKKISWQYPVIEILTALLFLLIFNFQFSIINTIFLLYITSSLIVIFVYDLRHYIIPDKILFGAIAATFLYQFIVNYQLFFGNIIWAALGSFIFFYAIFFISKGRGMGFGDVKLAILLGLLLGFPNIVLALFLSFLLGAVVGLALMFFGRKGLKSQLPFAPFLIVGTFLALLWGPQIINWYMGLFTF